MHELPHRWLSCADTGRVHVYGCRMRCFSRAWCGGCASAVALFVWGCKENNINIPAEKGAATGGAAMGGAATGGGATGGAATGGSATGGSATGGSGGGGAMGGTGGESTEPAPDCVTPADCPEADTCEKAPTCEDGVCVRGGSECGDFDADNCACVESGNGCVVQGADKDDDGATSALCEVDPGDDCDDSLATVHPGAGEVCDGLDNDCDGLLEIDEGLLPFTRRVQTPAPIAALSWSPVAEGYGVAWQTTVNTTGGAVYDLSFGIVKTDGSFTETVPMVMRGSASTSATSSATSVAFGDGEFGVARIYGQGADNAILRFRRLAATGTAAAGPVVTIDTSATSPQGLQVFSTVAGEWFIMYRLAYLGDTVVTRLVDDAVVSTEIEVPLAGTTPGFATTDGILAGWYTSTGQWEHKWSAFGSGSADAIAHEVFGPTAQFGATFSAPASSLAYAFRNYPESRVDFASVNAQGWECQGVAAPHTDGIDPIGIVKVPNGWVIAHAYDPSGRGDTGMRFSQVYEDCSTSLGLAQQSLDITGAGYVSQAAGNGNGFAVSWYEGAETSPGTLSLFGPNICDDPDH